MANTDDPDQTAPEQAVRSGSALFAYSIFLETGVQTFSSFTIGHFFSTKKY